MPEPTFEPPSVAIAVITYYPKWYKGELRSIKHTDKVRGDLALEFFRRVSKTGYIVICADGKSTKSFQKELRSIENIKIIIRKSNGSGSSKRMAIKKASKTDGVKVIVLTEAEKVSLITDCLQQIVEPILNNTADIVVPKRNEKLFKATYPDYMYESEKEANNIYNEALRTNAILASPMQDFDYFFGPRALKNDKKTLSLFMRRYQFVGESILSNLYDPDKYSNILFFPIINALKMKLRVVNVEVPFSYPLIQKENEAIGAREEFILKRDLQRVSLLIDLMHFLSLLGKKKSSKLRSVV